MNRISAILTVITLATAPALVATPASAAAPYCGIRWGSTPETRSAGSTGELRDVRTGRHACYDRMVLDVSGNVSGYVVRYVAQVRQDGSGHVVPLRGGARLEVAVTAPTVATDAWFEPGGELTRTVGYPTFRQVAWAGSFEGQSTIGLGVRARLPFRVLLLDGPGTGSRLVVDVAHRW